MIFNGYGILRSITKRTWYKNRIVRITIDIPAEVMKKESVLKLDEFHNKEVFMTDYAD